MNLQPGARTEQQQHSTRFHGWQKVVVYVTAAIVVLLFIVAVIPGGRRAQPGFYETAGQIIPVLILTLAVEKLWRGWSFKARLPVVAVLVLGLFAAMVGTAYDVQKDGTAEYLVASSRLLTDLLEACVVASIGVGLIAVLWSTFFERDVDAVSKPQSDS